MSREGGKVSASASQTIPARVVLSVSQAWARLAISVVVVALMLSSG